MRVEFLWPSGMLTKQIIPNTKVPHKDAPLHFGPQQRLLPYSCTAKAGQPDWKYSETHTAYCWLVFGCRFS